MSIESVRARMAELEARISGLSARPEPTRNAITPPASLDGRPLQIAGLPPAGGAGVQPFNVALAAKLGDVGLLPAGGGARFSDQIESLISKHSAAFGLDPNVVRAVIRAESDGNPKAVSHKGAMGLMQLMPDEVRTYGITDPFDIDQNIMGGARQLSEKLKVFGGDLKLTLAAYNAGTGAVKRYGGIPPFPETQKYVDKVIGMLGK